MTSLQRHRTEDPVNRNKERNVIRVLYGSREGNLHLNIWKRQIIGAINGMSWECTLKNASNKSAVICRSSVHTFGGQSTLWQTETCVADSCDREDLRLTN